MSAQLSDLDAYLEATSEHRLAWYEDLLRIPSVSGLPEHAADCRAAAEFLAAELRRAGLEHVEVSETGGHPIVYADWLHAEAAPTILTYAHYDVQPPDPIELWDSSPFEPVVKDGRILARGASDDKANVSILVRALEAVLATRGRLPVNVRVVMEGEEESSSVHLDPWLESNRARLQADVAHVSDSGFFEGNRPAITVGLRGLVYVQIDVTGSHVDLHSGSFGGAVQNPANALCEIVAALKGPDGRIRIPGFYDDVVELTEVDRAAFAALPFDEGAWRTEIGVPAGYGEVGFTTLERRAARPTLDVNGLWSGFQGEGSKTIIPAHAHAKVSCRLVANQDPNTIFEQLQRHVLQVAPPGVRVEVQNLGVGYPSLTPIDHPATQAAARSLEATFGAAPLYVREGGSVPITASFEKLLGLPVVLLGFMPPNERAHAPNEWMDLDNHEKGIRAMARFWDEMATRPR